MIAFALVLAAGDYLPESSAFGLAAMKVLAPLLLFRYFQRKGCYPELSGFRFSAGSVLDVLVGLLVAAVWMAPYLLWEGLRPADAGVAFDPAAAGPDMKMSMLALRLAGFAFVTPFVEELLVRSFLMREAEVYDTAESFRSIPIGVFAWKGFLFTLVWFTFTHATWEWPVAFATGIIYNVWLYKRRHIGSLILTHAVTNAALFAAVIWADGVGRDWWFFL